MSLAPENSGDLSGSSMALCRCNESYSRMARKGRELRLLNGTDVTNRVRYHSSFPKWDSTEAAYCSISTFSNWVLEDEFNAMLMAPPPVTLTWSATIWPRIKVPVPEPPLMFKVTLGK